MKHIELKREQIKNYATDIESADHHMDPVFSAFIFIRTSGAFRRKSENFGT